MRIAERTRDRLVIDNRPRISFGIAVGLGAVALLSTLYSIVFSREGLSTNNVFGLILGPLFAGGGLLLYRRTTTVFLRESATVSWEQSGLLARRRDVARFDEIRDLVVGRAASDESGGATRVGLVLDDRVIPLMFGFSACNPDKEVVEAIRSFIGPDGSRQAAPESRRH